MKSSKSGGRRAGAADAGASIDQPRMPWIARLWSAVGVPWILVGMTTYTFLTVLGRNFLHSSEGLAVLRKEVPTVVYDRSSAIFLTALAIDLLNIVFERQTIKLDCVLLPAFIKGMASTTNLMVRFFNPVVALTEAGRPVVVQRYICWMHTTPSILMLLKMISSTITAREVMTAILFDEVMVVTGVLALVTTGWQRVLWSIITHAAMLPVVPYMHKAFTECIAARRSAAAEAPLWAGAGAGGSERRGAVSRAMEQVRTRPLQLTMLFIYVLNLVLWCTFAVTWDLALLGWISVTVEEVLYVGCDFSAKVLFSSTLMLSSFKEFEARRENAMRVIEGSSKAKLIAELQALLEQKERFMSSVSHELRTPLNGIIGISEGMLSGCCGVLPEGVRRQIYIIRTSGARLLALINDVMDAAALRQNKLVLKQEQTILRHVVDDVLDLTRSLVDSEVTLANLVPPRMLVVGDTGRIVQILNNLLGNAAKFTRRGHIRVTARQVEGGRRVAVTVSDTGIGIPRNKLATIFLPFEQVDMSISRKYGGFGLGLNIVQELVKAHGGTINVSSIEGKGSAFTFTLPLARAMGRESLEEAKAAVQRSGTAGTRRAESASGAAGGKPPTEGAVVDANASGSGSGDPRGQGTGSATLSVGTPRTVRGGDGCDDSSTVVSSSTAEVGRRAGFGAAGGGGRDNADSEMEQYGELMYNAAELSALASSRPYAQSVRESLPASVEGGTTSSVHCGVVAQQPRSARGGAGGGTATSSRVPPGAAAAVTRHLPPSRGTAAVADSSSAPAAQPGVDAKIVHGPRPFHFTMYKTFLLLSVEDDPVNQSVIKSLLSSTGYEVVAVPSGPEALHYVAAAAALPDLVLLDCMMPEMDGYEVLQRLRAMTPNVHVPIIMVSAQTEEEHVVCGLDLGADDYVTKPFKRNELLARIRAQLAYGEWEQDEAAMDTISSLIDSPSFLPGGGSGVSPAAGAASGGQGILDSGLDMGATAGAAGGGSDAAIGGLVAAAGGASLPGTSGSDQRLIVCIDDDDVNQVVLQGMLTSQHYRYVRASTGAQGLSYVCGAHSGGIPPDLVLLDCSLPDMTGFNVCRCIRQMYNKQQVPIIMLSARHNESAVVEGLKCGANTYVTKPFRRNELLARIRLHLRSREAAPAAHHTSRTESSAEESGGGGGGSAAGISAGGTSVKADRTASVTTGSVSGAIGSEGTPVGMGGGGGGQAAAAMAGGVSLWNDAAILVVAVADYAGLCRMLLPSEMAELTAHMLAAFDRAVASHGVIKIESGSGVMSAAVLPAVLPPTTADTLSSSASSAAATGLRLAALHRVGRALLDAAATIPVPGTATCVQLQQAMTLGTLMGHCTTSALANVPPTMLYFGPVLAELLDLARRAPPMTIVTLDGEAQALRTSGATADIRGPLFLETDDGISGAAGGLATRRLWLVEAHPYGYQYLPPQLLVASASLQFRGSFLQRSATEEDKASGSTTAAVAAATSSHMAAAAASVLQHPHPNLMHLQGQNVLMSSPSSQALLQLQEQHQHHQQQQHLLLHQHLQQQQQKHTHSHQPMQPQLSPRAGHSAQDSSSVGGAPSTAPGGGSGGARTTPGTDQATTGSVSRAQSQGQGQGTGGQGLSSSTSYAGGSVAQLDYYGMPGPQGAGAPSTSGLMSTGNTGTGLNPRYLSAAGVPSSFPPPSPGQTPPTGYLPHGGALSSPSAGLSGMALGHLGPMGHLSGTGGSVSNSAAFNTSLGLYGNGLGVSPVGSRVLSHNLALDSDTHDRLMPHLHLQQQHPANSSSNANNNTATNNAGNVHSSAVKAADAASSSSGAGSVGGGAAAAPTAIVSAGAGAVTTGATAPTPGSISPTTAGNGLDSSGGACITFSLQAAAAAIAAATAAASVPNSDGGGLGLPPLGLAQHLNSQTEGAFALSGAPARALSPASNRSQGLSGGIGPGPAAMLYSAQRQSTSFFGGGGGANLNSASGIVLGGNGGGGGGAGGFSSHLPGYYLGDQVDPAEPQIRALRNELAVMRQQLEALQCTSGRDSVAALGAAQLGPPATAPPQHQHQQVGGLLAAAGGSQQPERATTATVADPGSGSNLAAAADKPGTLLGGQPTSSVGSPPARRDHTTDDPVLAVARAAEADDPGLADVRSGSRPEGHRSGGATGAPMEAVVAGRASPVSPPPAGQPQPSQAAAAAAAPPAAQPQYPGPPSLSTASGAGGSAGVTAPPAAAEKSLVKKGSKLTRLFGKSSKSK